MATSSSITRIVLGVGMPSSALWPRIPPPSAGPKKLYNHLTRSTVEDGGRAGAGALIFRSNFLEAGHRCLALRRASSRPQTAGCLVETGPHLCEVGVTGAASRLGSR